MAVSSPAPRAAVPLAARGPVGPIALAFKVSAVTARHGLELGQLRLQGFDADLGSAPYDFATMTAVMNTRIGATKTTASASHTPAHKNVPTTAMTVPPATTARMAPSPPAGAGPP